jgi:hypothetical protein
VFLDASEGFKLQFNSNPCGIISIGICICYGGICAPKAFTVLQDCLVGEDSTLTYHYSDQLALELYETKQPFKKSMSVR